MSRLWLSTRRAFLHESLCQVASAASALHRTIVSRCLSRAAAISCAVCTRRACGPSSRPSLTSTRAAPTRPSSCGRPPTRSEVYQRRSRASPATWTLCTRSRSRLAVCSRRAPTRQSSGAPRSRRDHIVVWRPALVFLARGKDDLADARAAARLTRTIGDRYNLRTHEESLSWDAHETSITCLAAAEKLNLLCSGAEDGTICLWEVHADEMAPLSGCSAPHRTGGLPRPVARRLPSATVRWAGIRPRAPARCRYGRATWRTRRT